MLQGAGACARHLDMEGITASDLPPPRQVLDDMEMMAKPRKTKRHAGD